jgi:predicted CoA-binding protein
MERTTVVMGAVPEPLRYAAMAVERLLNAGHHVVPVGLRGGETHGLSILADVPSSTAVDTVTLYVAPLRLRPHHDRVLGWRPRRVVFNPGTEDSAFEQRLREAGVEVVVGCTLVMLATGQY